ncbi:MAG: hypothetical protein QM772_05800 [Ottowia sp.]|uniref:hypothetical protein n=1 Tax=Ottowia sp. TaxID=1898956 RepID=UPI0039E33050
MATYKGAAVWLHDSFGEYFFAWLVDRYDGNKEIPSSMQGIVNEAKESLEHSWIVGILQSFGDRYLKTEDDVSFMLGAMNHLSAELNKDQSKGNIFEFKGHPIRKDVATEELAALQRLLTGQITNGMENAEIYTLIAKKWAKPGLNRG